MKNKLTYALSTLLAASLVHAEPLDVEKDTLKFGFIKLTDCAPIVIAKEKGFFEAEGLQVEVIAQPNWKTLLDNVISGELDGAHMLSGQPIAAAIGFGTKALILAGQWLDATDESGKLVNRVEAASILSRADYVGADFDIIKNSMTGFFLFQKSDKREMPDFNVFYEYHCTYPWYSDGIWFLTQMRRWGQITEPKSEDWYLETAKEVYKPEVYLSVAKMLLAEGKIKKEDIPRETDGFKEATSDFIDGVSYDGKDPLYFFSTKGSRLIRSV
ncbi:ABC transporter substrate-binding protein [Akkermansiaceae bacterium]|nr:ABC transporter substrate-binding protein [bacterium]MDB0056997.1 ABC transporter substrate-binding protein [Akkermansiaceae bacterium]MDB4286979.1 ABC transporter substrate-binding protein [Akkermansiaceae bacterium]MDB4693499.1 ABC transporter substrate-binding protein [Akkermansiaceae bacterium]